MEAYLIDQFKALWDEVKIMVDFETKRLVGMHDQDIVKKLNKYYFYEILHELWFSKSFPNKYNAWYVALEVADNVRARKVEQILLQNSTLLDNNDEDWLVRNVIAGGLTGTGLFAAFAKRPKVALFMLGAALITFFFTGNENKIIAEAQSLVAKRLNEIKEKVLAVLE
ncbi:MAG: hypothetical protein KH111_06965 [Bacteroidales bacterium]|nr:hypothetical protein [Bacteroidales bacterium]